jgi:hypothetical protein
MKNGNIAKKNLRHPLKLLNHIKMEGMSIAYRDVGGGIKQKQENPKNHNILPNRKS